MSRSAAALAYDQDTTTRHSTGHNRRDQFRLLGEDDTCDEWQGVQTTQIEKHPTSWQTGTISNASAGMSAAFAQDVATVANEGSVPRQQVKNPLWLFGTFVCLVALLMIVGPAFANVLGGGPRQMPLSLSGYDAMTSIAGDTTVQLSLVDVSTSNQEPSAPHANAVSISSGPYDLTGSPSVSVSQIEAVLQQYASPAVGNGQALYEIGLRYGINPAYALAFFVHESGCGTKGVARFTHSIGNIRWTEGHGNYEGYRSYGSWEDGIEDWYRLISDLYVNGWHLRTVDAIVPVYAPYGDNNNPPSYIAAVKQMVDAWRGK